MLRLSAEPVLVGRKRELEMLNALLDSVVDEKGKTVFVSGEAGTGKTRLVNEFLDSAKEEREFFRLTGWCLSNVEMPYFPFVEALKAYFSSSPLKGETAKEKQQQVSPFQIAPQASKESTFATFAEALFSMAAKKVTILFIDDLHWADSVSLLLLHYLSRVISSHRIFIIATFRSEELCPDEKGNQHPLVDVLRLMHRENLFEEIKLTSLNQEETLSLAESMLGGHIDVSFGQRLADESQGNPLFTVESLRMLVERGRLIRRDRGWVLRGDELEIPTKIKDIVLRRAAFISQDLRKLLDLASVAGVRFNPEILSAVLGENSLKIIEELSNIANTTHLIAGEEDIFRFDHAKSRDAIYEEITPPLKRAYHRKIAEALETRFEGKKPPVNDLAYHYAQAGNKKKSVQFAIMAGEEALTLFSGAEAVRHFKYVLATTDENKQNAHSREIALEGFGDGLYAMGNVVEAARAFEKLTYAADSNLVKLRALRKALYVKHFLGDFTHSQEIAKEAMKILAQTPELDRLECARARVNSEMVHRSVGSRKVAILGDEEAVCVFEDEFSLADLVDSLPELAWTYADDGQIENALATAIRAVALGEHARSLDRLDNALMILCLLMVLCGLKDEAERVNKEEFKLAARIVDPLSRWWNQAMSNKMSGVLLETQAADEMFSQIPFNGMEDYRGQQKSKFLLSASNLDAVKKFRQTIEAAIERSLKGAEAAEESDSNHVLSVCYSNLLRQYSQIGENEKAKKYFTKMAKLFGETSLKDYLFLRADWQAAGAAYFAAQHEWIEANRLYEESLETYRKIGPPNYAEAMARNGYGWALLQQGQVIEAKAQFCEAKAILDNLEKRLIEANVKAYLAVSGQVELGKEFNARLDVINVSKHPCALVSVEGFFPSDFDVMDAQPNHIVQGSTIDLRTQRIDPFQDKAIMFKLHAKKAGLFRINMSVHYGDEAGQSRVCMLKTATVAVQPKKTNRLKGYINESIVVAEKASASEEASFNLKFTTDAAEKAFGYLVDSFVLDYMRRRLSLDWSGWRTLMEIVKGVGISKRSVYGDGKYRGRAIIELKKRGLVEARVFPEERGRGGQILKIRVPYDRDIVKRLVDFRVVEAGKKKLNSLMSNSY